MPKDSGHNRIVLVVNLLVIGALVLLSYNLITFGEKYDSLAALYAELKAEYESLADDTEDDIPAAVRYNSVPVLTYHVIDEPQQPWPELYVPPEAFAKQLDYLKDNGFHTITITNLLLHWESGEPLPARPVIITFDDGYKSVYDKAYPLLKQRGQVATVFLETRKMGTENGLGEEQLREMMAHGFELGSHTINHPDLTTLTPDKLQQELAESKRILEDTFNVDVMFFAYPGGKHNEQVVSAVAQAGYRAAFTTEYGPASIKDSFLTLKRIAIYRSDGLSGFAAKIGQVYGY